VTDHQPLLQLSTPSRQNEEPQVVLRLDSDKDVEAAIALINRTSEVLVPLAAGLVDHLARALQGEAVVTGQLQAAGLNPVPMQQAYPVPDTRAQTVQAPAQPVYQPQQQSTQAYAPPAQQAAPQQMILMQGQCWADPRHVADCKDCGQATYLKTVKMRGDRELNAHQCAVDPNHKLTWCMTPIWESRRRDAQGKGIQVPDGLIFG
jgi:hypothetical protein